MEFGRRKLVPLFLKDGDFPLFVDSEDEPDVEPKKTMVRFQDEMSSDVEDITVTDTSHFNQSRLSPEPVTPSAYQGKSITRTSYLHSGSSEPEQGLQNITTNTPIKPSY
ncbi:hypothetical protein KIN20_003682 [Parelaphostrongylus tenuis]|uniref:Uncharacterized protein n=1 Tax=Parelaphostrongylus tenuis TaxID=148309 RepID=A0AAD5QDW7_PARTN|nr:hypothetical protein KIN20_003682 [Parelaphostrongylus tenuis]